MESTASVSKGCFAFPAPAKGKRTGVNSPLNCSGEPWFIGYKSVWEKLVRQLDTVEDAVIENLMQELVSFIAYPVPLDNQTSHQIPAAALLTGINLPDHGSLFLRLKSRLRSENVACGVAILNSNDCPSVKHAVERCVGQLIENPVDSEDELESDDEEDQTPNLKRSHCTLTYLSKWYESVKTSHPSPSKKKKTSLTSEEKRLVIILRDFETYNPNILNIFIQVLSGYKLPFVLVFGIATTLSAIDNILPHSSISRLSLKPFQAQPSVFFLNNTLNKVLLTADCPFQLSGKLFQFFSQVFLFYDFSVNRFIQGIKYCVMEHFRVGGRPIGLLCCPESNLKISVEKMTHSDVEYIRRLKSFRIHVESTADKQERVKLLSDVVFTKKEILKLMLDLRKRIQTFYSALSLLHCLVYDLPQSPLGKQLRELYTVTMCKDVWTTPEYKECRQLLGFLSKEELIEKVNKMTAMLHESKTDHMNDVEEKLQGLLAGVRDAGISKGTRSPKKSPVKNVQMVKNRAQLKQIVFELASKDKSKSAYELARDDLLNYLMNEMFPSLLRPFTSATLWEVVTLVENEARYRVVPRIRAPIHTALNNPARYLMCDCCKITDDEEIHPTMPDLCIAYKLHLESGPLINMYDWLQSFNVLVSGKENDGDDDDDIDLKVQARFTQAVSEMEYLGFIKSSKKKADHVARLTWGGSTS